MAQIPQNKEEFLDWFNEVTKQDRATHSDTLNYINKSLNGYGRGWKLLKTDIGFFIAMITFLISIIAPYFLIRTDIAVMNEKLDTVIKEVSIIQSSNKTFSQFLGQLDSRVSKIEGAMEVRNELKTNQKTP